MSTQQTSGTWGRVSPPPTNTPRITSGSSRAGIPFDQRTPEDLNNTENSPEWNAYHNGIFQRVSLLPCICDKHSNRVNYPPENYVNGSDAPASQGLAPVQQVNMMLYYESDRGVFYGVQQVSNIPTWVYVFGIFAVVQSAIAALAASLGSADNGLLVNVTDYQHVLMWNGVSFVWGPGESGSGYIQLFATPPGTGWHQCDGSGVNILNANGSTQTINTPDFVHNPAYLKASSFYGGPAIAPAAIPTLGPSTNNASNVPQTGGPLTVATSTHSHAVNLTGDPIPNVQMFAYLRR